jgi:hypothetical protein
MNLTTLCFYHHADDEWWVKMPDGSERTEGMTKERAWDLFLRTIELPSQEQLPIMREGFDLCPVGAVLVIQDESRIFAIVVDPERQRPPTERLPWIYGLINEYLILALRKAGRHMAERIGCSADILRPGPDLSEAEEAPKW